MTRPKDEIRDFDPEKIAKDLGLTDLQRRFAEYYIFLTGLDGDKAVELAGYKIATSDYYKDYDPSKGDHYTRMLIKKQARELLTNVKVLRYIKALRDNLDKQLIIDKLYVLEKLKALAVSGSENTQLQAIKLLGQYLQMFTEVQRYEIADDPSKIIKEAIERRKKESNLIPFNPLEVNSGN